MKIAVKYSETMKQVLALVIIPLSLMVILMFVLFSIDLKHFSETVQMVLIFAFVIVAMALSIFIVLKIISANATMEYDNRFVHIALNKKSFLYPNQEFQFNYTNIENAALSEDSQSRIFVTIKLKTPNKTILLSPINTNSSAEFLEFWNGFADQINSYNSTIIEHPELKINSIGFYETKLAKVFAIISVVLTVGFTIAKIIYPNLFSIYKLILIYCYSIPFATAVYFASKKNKNQE